MAERETVELSSEPVEVVKRGLSRRVATCICTACALMTLILRVLIVDARPWQHVSEAALVEEMKASLSPPTFEEVQCAAETNKTLDAREPRLQEGLWIQQRAGWAVSATAVAALNAFMLHTTMLRSDASQWEEITSWPTSLPMAVLAVLLSLMSLQTLLHEEEHLQARRPPVGLINTILAVFTVCSIWKCISLPLDVSLVGIGKAVEQLVDSKSQVILLIGLSGLPVLMSLLMVTSAFKDSDGLWCWPVVTIIAIMFGVWCTFVALYWKVKVMLDSKSTEIAALTRYLQQAKNAAGQTSVRPEQGNGKTDAERQRQKALTLVSPEFWFRMMTEAVPRDVQSELKLMELYEQNVRLLVMLEQLHKKYPTVGSAVAPKFRQPLREVMSFVPEMIKLVVKQRFDMSSDDVLLPLPL